MHKLALISFASMLAIGSSPAVYAEDALPPPAVAPCISWRNPLIEPRFALLCVHGLGLYSRSYQHFGQRMARQGAVVYAIDVRGFGSWMNAKGHSNVDFDGCLQDIKTALQSIKQAHPNLPRFLLGESMGGAIALRAATMYPDLIDGVISAVPAGERFKQKRTDLKVAFEFLAGPRKRHEAIGKQVVDQAATAKDAGDPAADKYNAQLAKAWEEDPLDRLDLSPTDLMQFQRFMNDNHEAVKKLKVPVLFVQGLDDDLVRPDGTWELIKEVGIHDRSLVALPARHLMFEETQATDASTNRQTLHAVLAWVNSHMPDHVIPETPVQKVSGETAFKITQGQPTVIAFYARWCDQCDRIERFVQRAQNSGSHFVRFVKYDVDAPANQDLVREFSVGALPQVVFLKPDGTISSTVIGETTLAVLLKHVAGLVNGN